MTADTRGILRSVMRDKIRDSEGISKLTIMQLILPYKISCIRGSSDIPLLSLTGKHSPPSGLGEGPPEANQRTVGRVFSQ